MKRGQESRYRLKREYVARYGSICKHDNSYFIDNLAVIVDTSYGKLIKFGDIERDREDLQEVMFKNENDQKLFGGEVLLKLVYLELRVKREQLGIKNGLEVEDVTSILNYLINVSGVGVISLVDVIRKGNIDELFKTVDELRRAGY